VTLPRVVLYHAPRWRLIALPLLVFLVGAVSLWAEPSLLSRLPDLKTHRTVSRRFVAVSSDSLDNMEAGRWAEDVADRVEALLGMSLPFAGRQIRIVIRPPAVTTNRVDLADCRLLALTQQLDDSGQLIQRLVIPAPGCLPQETIRAAFCRLLLEGFFPRSRAALRRSAPQPVAVPRWFSIGLARNLTREEREDDARRLLEAWQRGEVTPLLGWLARDTQAPPQSLDGPIAGMLVAWLLKPPGGAERMVDLFDRLDQGHPVTADWLAAQRVGGAATTDVDSAWDAWIMRQQHKVFRPGTTPPEAVEGLAAELLLYPGGFGIPLASAIARGDGFDALIAQREADWIATFCRSKQGALRLHAVGRGRAFHAVVDDYVAFLDGLAKGKRASRLRELLDVAEAAMREMVLVRGRASPHENG